MNNASNTGSTYIYAVTFENKRGRKWVACDDHYTSRADAVWARDCMRGVPSLYRKVELKTVVVYRAGLHADAIIDARARAEARINSVAPHAQNQTYAATSNAWHSNSPFSFVRGHCAASF